MLLLLLLVQWMLHEGEGTQHGSSSAELFFDDTLLKQRLLQSLRQCGMISQADYDQRRKKVDGVLLGG